jgi:hypothetical protein
MNRSLLASDAGFGSVAILGSIASAGPGFRERQRAAQDNGSC